MKRLVIFAGYDRDGVIQDYVVHYLRRLRELAQIVYVADCEMRAGELDKIAPFVCAAMAARHGEYDFGSYKRGFFYARENGLLDGCDELFLCNDSVYGPLELAGADVAAEVGIGDADGVVVAAMSADEAADEVVNSVAGADGGICAKMGATNATSAKNYVENVAKTGAKNAQNAAQNAQINETAPQTPQQNAQNAAQIPPNSANNADFTNAATATATNHAATTATTAVTANHAATAHSLREIITQMEARECDFWGLYRYEAQDWVSAAHVQSWFVALRPQCFLLGEFAAFLASVAHQPNKREIIVRYEIGLSALLTGLGFKMDAFLGTDGGAVNMPGDDIAGALRAGLCFIKIGVLRGLLTGRVLLDERGFREILRQLRGDDVERIIAHLNATTSASERRCLLARWGGGAWRVGGFELRADYKRSGRLLLTLWRGGRRLGRVSLPRELVAKEHRFGDFGFLRGLRGAGE